MLSKLLRVAFIVVFAGYSFTLLSAYFSYIEPYLFPLRMIQGEARYVTENIIIGPYPHEKDIEKLVKVEKVKIIISLLNPSIPFEGSLVKKEREIAQKYGLKFYNFPMSYIGLDTKENNIQVMKIKEVIRKHPGEKVYIHCYLGRHRVEFVARKLIGDVK